jgi:FkbM family methyltransferase
VRSVTLTDGARVWAPNRRDVRLVERELSAAGAGFVLDAGDRVVDVGANAGLYSIALARRYGRLRLVLVEPNPEVFAALTRNAAEHLAACEVALIDCAVADAPGWAELEVDPRLTVAGSITPGAMGAAARRDAPGREWIAAAVRDAAPIGELSPAVATLALRALETPGLSSLIVGAATLLHRAHERGRRRRLQRLRRPVRTISQLIAEHAFERVDLLKIDVEGAELAALRGIEHIDWPKIRQLLVEVHDVDGRLATVEAMLRERGYRVRRQPSIWALHDLLGIATLEAVRP